jgi:hypothetical protein
MLISYIISLFRPKGQASTSTPKICDHRVEQPSAQPCHGCIAERRRSRKYRWKVILGLAFPAALHALDATMYVALGVDSEMAIPDEHTDLSFTVSQALYHGSLQTSAGYRSSTGSPPLST